LSKMVMALVILKADLQKETYLLDSLMICIPASIYFKDTDRKLTRVSKYMVDRLRCTVDELIGKSDFDFQDEVHAKEAFPDEQEIQLTRKAKIDYVEKEVRKDGSVKWITTTKLT